MATKKKTFMDNPALAFISADPDAEEREPQAPEISPERPPEGFKRNPLYVETKSRRLQLVLQPSLYNRVKAGAAASGLSVNEYVHQILEKATKEG